MAQILKQEALLPLFLLQAASIPFCFGEWDCAMLLANWWRFVLGTDPAPELRQSYDSERGWRRIVLKAGGLIKVVDGVATRVGGVKVGMPQVGDIAVISTNHSATGAIWVGRYWVNKTPSGLSAGNALALGIWGLR